MASNNQKNLQDQDKLPNARNRVKPTQTINWIEDNIWASFLTTSTATILLQSTILGCLEFCNSLLRGLPESAHG